MVNCSPTVTPIHTPMDDLESNLGHLVFLPKDIWHADWIEPPIFRLVMTSTLCFNQKPKQPLHKDMTQHRRASSTGQDSAVQLHLKGKGHSSFFRSQAPYPPHKSCVK